MDRVPRQARAQLCRCLVAGDHGVPRRFADDHRGGSGYAGGHRAHHRGRSAAGEFFIVREGDVDRPFQIGFDHVRNKRQRESVESLHVRGPASVEPASAFGQRKGVARPGLSLHRNHIRVAGQDDPALDHGSDRRVEIGLAALGIEDEIALNAVALQPVAAEMNDVEIAGRRNARKGNQAREHFAGRQLHRQIAPWISDNIGRDLARGQGAFAFLAKRISPIDLWVNAGS